MKFDIIEDGPGGQIYYIPPIEGSGATSGCGGGVALLDMRLSTGPATTAEYTMISVDIIDIQFGYSQC